MPQRNVFLALPEDLYVEAWDLADLRQISISDLLIEALSEIIETERRAQSIEEPDSVAPKRPTRVQ
ncbi:hypothetical protein [Terriglobus aquaticus]|uniref:CopG-like ribbon-helix-helix domain-containing protein n=1 Tax=Terriglobus aquaticus TaxID=940139 RepID=A0ABW9KMR2_9BACT|nr:hypothetical protein [Terriglobus aquaticus]